MAYDPDPGDSVSLVWNQIQSPVRLSYTRPYSHRRSLIQGGLLRQMRLSRVLRRSVGCSDSVDPGFRCGARHHPPMVLHRIADRTVAEDSGPWRITDLDSGSTMKTTIAVLLSPRLG